MTHRAAMVLALALALQASSARAQERLTQGRRTWYAGVGLGAGGGGLRIGDRDRSFEDVLGRSAPIAAVAIRFGSALSDELMVGFEGSAVGAVASKPSEQVQLNRYDLGVTWLPRVDGPFLRVAAGRTVVGVKSDGPELYGSGTYGGWNAALGGGWSQPLFGSGLHAVLHVAYEVHTVAKAGLVDVTSGRGWSATLGLDWYGRSSP
ncbi:MAG: hypothetical protein QM704_06440 [Anaeromyxobacteraceae bacterium]